MVLITDRLPRWSSVLSFSMKHVGSRSKNTFSDSLFEKLTSKARPLRKAWQDLQEQKKDLWDCLEKEQN